MTGRQLTVTTTARPPVKNGIRAGGPRPYRWNMALVALIILVLTGIHSPTVTLDDAYITYRYAENLAEHGGLFYNATGPAQSFATTAPVYAVLLGGLATLGLDIPTVGGWLSILSMILASWALSDLLSPWSRQGGLFAGVLLAAFPMSWLVLGMEGLPALALALLGLALSLRGRNGWAALALAAATLLRFDAATAAVLWGILLPVRFGLRSSRVWRPTLMYVLTVVIGYGALMFLLNVPPPSTLGSKQAQVALGITGFFSDTNYLEGIVLLARAYWAHSPFYLLLPVLAAIGVIGVLRLRCFAVPLGTSGGEGGRLPLVQRFELWRPFLALGLWALLHIALYIALGVTPYGWYYLPVAPLVCALAAAGIITILRPLKRAHILLEASLGVALLLLALIGPAVTHALMAARSSNIASRLAPRPQTLADKALPGTQYRAYRAVGEWLEDNTPQDVSVGVTEVGIMGYYSRRPMVDFLGLLDGEIARALARGDMAWAMYARQPDYVAFSDLNPTYAYGVYQDAWFQGAYDPRHQVDAQGFWGGDLTVYARTVPPVEHGVVDTLPPNVEPLQIRFDDTFELVGMTAPPGPWRGGQAAGTTFYWRVLTAPQRDYKLFVHLVDDQGRIITGHDRAPLLGERPTHTWQPTWLLADFHPLGLPPLPLAPTSLTWEIGFYDPKTGERLPAFGPDGIEMTGGQARFGTRELLPAEQPAIFGADEPDHCRIAIQDTQVEGGVARRGGKTMLTLNVADVSCPASLTVDLWDWNAGRAVWEQTASVAQPGPVTYTLEVAAGEAAAWPGLRLAALRGDVRLHWLDDAGHAVADTLNLTPLSLAGP